jgi:hypothetical protein
MLPANAASQAMLGNVQRMRTCAQSLLAHMIMLLVRDNDSNSYAGEAVILHMQYDLVLITPSGPTLKREMHWCISVNVVQ